MFLGCIRWVVCLFFAITIITMFFFKGNCKNLILDFFK